MKKSNNYLYLLQSIFILPSVLYWLNSLSWSLDRLNVFSIFPVLGLIAFTIMWFHLMVAAVKKIRPKLFDYGSFYKFTSIAVLGLIVAHPGLIIYQSLQDETSFLSYSGSEGRLFIVFGLIALIVFLSYEFFERAKEKDLIKNNWQFVVALNRIGFILVFIHGLQIGQHLQNGWLRALWLFYGATSAIYILWAFSREIRIDSVATD